MSDRTATEIMRRVSATGADVRIYKLSETIKCDWLDHQAVDVVAVSAVSRFLGPETMVFASSDSGEVTDWAEIGGVDVLCHKSALLGIGFTIQEEAS